MYGHHPQNLLVANQFNPESFQVVQQVYCRLEELRSIYRHLNVINSLGSNINRVAVIEPYLHDIRRIEYSLNELLTLEGNLDFLKEIAPRISYLTGNIEIVEGKICHFEEKFHEVLSLMESNTKNLEDLFVQYEEGLQRLTDRFKQELCNEHEKLVKEVRHLTAVNKKLNEELENNMPVVRKAVKFQKETEAILAHVQASDAVTLALFTESEEDSSNALKLIKTSEKFGNKEEVNRSRLNYKLASNNLFNVMKKNQERITKEQEKVK